jgi:hypothetical protein
MDSFVEHATAANGVAVGTAPVSATTTSTTSATTTTTRPPPTTTAPAPTTTWAPVLGWVEGGCVAEVGDDYVELVSCSSRSADWMITQMTFHKDYCPMSSTVFVELELGTVACLE